MSSFSGVGHRFDVVEQDVGPEDTFGRDVNADAGRLVDGVGDDGGQEGSVHSRSQDSVVVSDEHEADSGIKGQIDRAVI